MCETSNRPALLARPVVLGQDAGRVLHRHVVAGERHHAGAERATCSAWSGVVRERSSCDGGFGHRLRPRKTRATGLRPVRRAPSVRDLRDFPAPAGAASSLRPSVGDALRSSPLSRVPAPARSFCLSVSGAVAPSAPGTLAKPDSSAGINGSPSVQGAGAGSQPRGAGLSSLWTRSRFTRFDRVDQISS